MVTVKRIGGGALFQLGRRQSEGRRHGRCHAAARQLHDEFDAVAKRHLVGIRGRIGHHPVMSLIRTTLRERAGQPLHLVLRQPRQQLGDLSRGAGRAEGQVSRPARIYHFLDARSRTSTCSTACSTASALRRGNRGAGARCGRSRRLVHLRPGPMMDAAEGALLDRNVPKERIHIERFTADRPAEAVARGDCGAADQGGGRQRRGHPRRADAQACPFTAGNILDSARAAGLPAPFACKAGSARPAGEGDQAARSRWPRATG